MCTVTLIPRPQGFRLAVNRDEQRTRPPATPPRVFQHAPQQALYPLDPPSAGTWVAVTNAGLALTLLNQKLPPPRK